MSAAEPSNFHPADPAREECVIFGCTKPHATFGVCRAHLDESIAEEERRSIEAAARIAELEAEVERLRGEVAEAKAARDRWRSEVDYAAAGERLQTRRDTWADIAATLNDRAVMWEQEGRQALAQECKGMANACRTYAEGVGVPSVDSLRQKRREAQARLDALVAELRGLHRPDGGSGGPGAMCVECTPDFGTRYEEPASWPCPTIAVLDKHAGE